MKRDLLVVPVLLTLAIGLAVGYRWWAQRTDRGQLTDTSVLDIQELDENARSLADRLAIPYSDAQQLNAVDETTGSAVVRLGEDGRSFTVAASLPRLASGAYQVWLRTNEGLDLLGSMREGKGVYLFDYLSANDADPAKPLTIVVSEETTLDRAIERPIFEGELQSSQE